MTLKELSQLYRLNREIEADTKRLAELESQMPGTSGAALTGMPRGPCENKIERYVAEVTDLKEIIAAKQRRCIYEEKRLMRYIADIPDSLTRQIFTLRFRDGLSWRRIAFEVGNNTEDSVKKICYRYLKKNRSCPECPE